MNTMLGKLKFSFSLLLIITLIVPSVLATIPQNADAQTSGASSITNAVPTADILNNPIHVTTSVASQNTTIQTTLTNSFFNLSSYINENVLKKLAVTIAKSFLQSITQSIVKWINSGFQGGGPSFLTNTDDFFTGWADQLIGSFVYGSELGFLCTPFQLDIRIQLARDFMPFQQQIKCTLSGITKNVQGFLNNNNGRGFQNAVTVSANNVTTPVQSTQPSSWSQWTQTLGINANQKQNIQPVDWNTWQNQTLPQGNDPYSAYVAAKNEISIRLLGQQDTKLKELDWGNGFLSWDTCTQYETQDQAATRIQNAGNNGTLTAAQIKSYTSGNLNCVKTQTNTPGSVVVAQLNKALGTQGDALNLANDINEIIGALFNQLVTQVMGGVGGLLGTNTSSSNYQSAEAQQEIAYMQDLANKKQSAASSTTDQVNQQTQATTDQVNSLISNESHQTGTSQSTYNTYGSSNVAQDKSASQSTTQGSNDASYAVDGNTTGKTSALFGLVSATHIAETQKESTPWWQVDLGAPTMINQIEIWPYTGDNATTTLGSFTVSILNSDGSSAWQSDTLTYTSTSANPFAVTVNGGSGTNGQIVKIQRTSSGINCQQQVSGYTSQYIQGSYQEVPTYVTVCDPTQLELAEVQVMSATTTGASY
jgi:F5/8 type C domain